MSKQTQTAVEWIISELFMFSDIPDSIKEKVDQANKMFNEQIENAFNEGWSTPHGEKGMPQSGNEYYTETYGSK